MTDEETLARIDKFNIDWWIREIDQKTELLQLEIEHMNTEKKELQQKLRLIESLYGRVA